jgi:hypothetical protein
MVVESIKIQHQRKAHQKHQANHQRTLMTLQSVTGHRVNFAGNRQRTLCLQRMFAALKIV